MILYAALLILSVTSFGTHAADDVGSALTALQYSEKHNKTIKGVHIVCTELVENNVYGAQIIVFEKAEEDVVTADDEAQYKLCARYLLAKHMGEESTPKVNDRMVKKFCDSLTGFSELLKNNDHSKFVSVGVFLEKKDAGKLFAKYSALRLLISSKGKDATCTDRIPDSDIACLLAAERGALTYIEREKEHLLSHDLLPALCAVKQASGLVKDASTMLKQLSGVRCAFAFVDVDKATEMASKDCKK